MISSLVNRSRVDFGCDFAGSLRLQIARFYLRFEIVARAILASKVPYTHFPFPQPFASMGCAPCLECTPTGLCNNTFLRRLLKVFVGVSFPETFVKSQHIPKPSLQSLTQQEFHRKCWTPPPPQNLKISKVWWLYVILQGFECWRS